MTFNFDNLLSPNSYKVGIVSLGCPKNLVDSEAMLGLLRDGGFAITPSADEADIIIINTCGFIDDAKKESIDTILEMSDKKYGKCKFLVVTGCLSERYAESFEEEFPEVDAILGTGNYINIVDVLKSLINSSTTHTDNDPHISFRKISERSIDERLAHQNTGRILSTTSYRKISDCSIDERLAHLNTGGKILSTGGGYAYIKIAEGCDNHCSYCIIPSLRGNYISRRIEDVIEDVVAVAADGAKEIILVAQDITRYGYDIYGEYRLCELINTISALSDIKWIRLLYSYPDLIGDDLIGVLKNNSKVLKYLDIPIQHASSSVLKNMGRRYDENFIKKLLLKLRTEIPGIALRSTLITGFPGELEEDFECLKGFVEQIKFERLGVFAYSREEGTPAANMGMQISSRVAAKRRMEILRLQRSIINEYEESRIGQVYEAIVDASLNNCYTARTYAEAPGIDGSIRIETNKKLSIGDFVYVKITGFDKFGLWSVLNDEFTK